jgi:hypothetical protein
MHHLERQSVPQVYPNSAASIVSLDPTERFLPDSQRAIGEKHSNRTAWTLENVLARSSIEPLSFFPLGGSSSSKSHISRLLLTEMGQGVLLDCSVAICRDRLSHLFANSKANRRLMRFSERGRGKQRTTVLVTKSLNILSLLLVAQWSIPPHQIDRSDQR